MMDWFLGGSKTEDGDASDKLIKQGDAEREAGDLTAALHYYGNAVAVAGSPKKRKSALLAQSRTYVLNGGLAEAEEAATRALDLGVCAPSLVRRGCARRSWATSEPPTRTCERPRSSIPKIGRPGTR